MPHVIICREPFIRQAAKEFVDEYPESARVLNNRIEKAIDLVESGLVVDVGVIDYTPTFAVKSQTKKIFYKVEGRGETWQICTCPDNQAGNRCKHGLAVLFALNAVTLEEEFRVEWEAAFPDEAREEEGTR